MVSVDDEPLGAAVLAGHPRVHVVFAVPARRQPALSVVELAPPDVARQGRAPRAFDRGQHLAGARERPRAPPGRRRPGSGARRRTGDDSGARSGRLPGAGGRRGRSGGATARPGSGLHAAPSRPRSGRATTRAGSRRFDAPCRSSWHEPARVLRGPCAFGIVSPIPISPAGGGATMTRSPGSRLGWLLRIAALLAVGSGLGGARPVGPPLAGAQAPAARGADHRRAARARPHGDAGLGDRDRRLLQHPGSAGEGGRPGAPGALARRAVAHDRQPELHLLPEEGRPLPQRPRAHGRGRQVRPRPRAQPRDQASPRPAVRGHRHDSRRRPAHGDDRAQAAQRDVHLQPRAAGLRDLPAGGGGPAEVAARRDRALRAGALGPRRPHRPQAKPRLPRQGAAEARARHVPLHPRRERRAGGAPGRRHRRDGLRARAGVGRGRAPGAESPGHPRARRRAT